MKRFLLSITVCAGVSMPSAFAQGCPSKNHFEIWMEGSVGESRVRAYLETQPEGSVEGAFYDVANWSPVSLEGTLSSDCTLRLKENHNTSPDGSVVEASWTATLRDSRTVTGNRIESGKSKPLQLEKVAPITCDGGGPWIRFQKAGFPISFDYPETWRVMEGDSKTLDVVCPNPFTLQISPNSVEFSLVEDVKTSTKYGAFIKSRGSWLFNGQGWSDCDSPDQPCEKARVSNRNGMTVLSGSGNVRLHGISGYAGIGEDEEYLFLLPDLWIGVESVMVGPKVTDRIMGSMRRQR